MYLKSIEMQGFKSFAGKTTLDFSQGITGIVGPNGSGKSNLSDAVRWVLGEQKTKQLRGQSMQDVIFAGTEARKPLGYAYVSITLDNHDKILSVDYDEVTVTRRLYRSGESEYILNGTECRLKDIQELFYDTGIGKDGYSIIGQGQIDRILSGKAEERRALFDEAVGIVKFKRRKELSQRKLEAEQQNLSRIRDILSELEKQVGPLKLQAEKAKKYLALRDELIVYECNLFTRDVDTAQEELREISENESNVEEDLKRLRQESDKLKGLYEELEERINSSENSINAYKEDISKCDLLKSNLKGQIDVAKERIIKEEERIKQYEKRIKNLNEERFNTVSEIEDALSVLNWLLEQFEFIREHESGKELISGADNSLLLINKTKDKIYKAVSSCMGEDYSLEIRPFNNTEESVEAHGDEFFDKIEEKRANLKKIKKDIESIRENISGLEYKIKDYEERNQLSLKLLFKKRRERDNAKNALESLRNLAERYEGYGNAVKAIMDRKERVPGIEGVVADLIDVPKEYETAIETALGGAVQNIVTRDEQTAKEQIQFLKQRRSGRATFLPLSNIRGKRDQRLEEAAKEKGAIGLGCDLIHYSPEYTSLSEYLLGRVLVADNMDHALQIERKYRQGLRIVTLEGELLQPGGSISGGAYRNSSSLVGRKRELEELEEKILKLEEEMEEARKKQEETGSTLSHYKAELENSRQALSRLEITENTASLSISSDLNVEYSSLSARTKYVSENIERLSGQLEKVFTELTDTEYSNRNSDDFLSEQKNKITFLEGEIDKTDNDAKATLEKISENEALREKLLLERKSFFSQKDSLSEELLLMEKEAMRIQNRKERAEQKIESLTAYMLDEYNLSYQRARERFSEEYKNLSELKKLISGQKKEIKKLGNVNVAAIEEYKETSERYSFLNSQHEDLVHSEESLKGILADLDNGMRKQFKENFVKIQEQFDIVFKELFGGGKGRIELASGDDDLLMANIEIVAEPPGKRLQNMMQLSGGEKALTAITLLFAIQALKPSPFCLLDEIEAALDESNVARFAEYLKKLTNRTQFIIITHRRGTMEHADRLFGITMQEKGISKLVSVNLIQDKLDN